MNPHPGTVLQKQFLDPLGITRYGLAKAAGLQEMTVHRLVHAKVGITAETALRLARFTCTTPMFWLDMQARYDVSKVTKEKGSEIEQTICPFDYTHPQLQSLAKTIAKHSPRV